MTDYITYVSSRRDDDNIPELDGYVPQTSSIVDKNNIGDDYIGDDYERLFQKSTYCIGNNTY